MQTNKMYSKEIKIQACKDYEEGNLSFLGISKEIGANQETVRRWYLRYKEHGPSAFKSSNKSRTYDKKFMLSVVEEYISGYYSLADLSAKHNIAVAVIQRWTNKWYNGIEIKDNVSKGDIYTMKSRKTTFEERLEIVKWVIENDMSYKGAAGRYGVTYALVYKWTRAYIEKGPEALKYKKRGPKSIKDENNLTKFDRVKLELEKEKTLRKRRELEIEVLKKKEEIEKKLRSRK